jgi:recombination protein RecT
MANRNDYVKSGQALQTQQANTPQALIQRHKLFLDQRMKQIQQWVREGVRPEALARFTLMEMSTNEKLRACTPDSIYLGLLACAVTGLEPGSLKGEAYLVPFAGKAQFMPGWKGLVKQVRRSRDVKGIVANVVRERDTFDLDLGTAKSLIHKPKLGGDEGRGEVIGAYAIATLAGGEPEIEWMDRADLDKIQRVAEQRGKSPAWAGWQDQMQRKSVIRRIAKRLPLGSDYYVALALEQAHDEGREQAEVLDIETDGAATRAQDQSEAAPDVEERAFNPETDTQA